VVSPADASKEDKVPQPANLELLSRTDKVTDSTTGLNIASFAYIYSQAQDSDTTPRTIFIAI